MEGEKHDPTRLPERLYFRIGDVANLIGVKPYVLRYWETEFPMISPQKSSTGQRVYRRSDAEMVLMIKHLLYKERYSIEGARNRLKELRKEGELKEFLASVLAASANQGTGAVAASAPIPAELRSLLEAHGVSSSKTSTDAPPGSVDQVADQTEASVQAGSAAGARAGLGSEVAQTSVAETNVMVAPQLKGSEQFKRICSTAQELIALVSAPTDQLFRY